MKKQIGYAIVGVMLGMGATMALNLDMDISNLVAYFKKVVFTTDGTSNSTATMTFDGLQGKIQGAGMNINMKNGLITGEKVDIDLKNGSMYVGGADAGYKVVTRNQLDMTKADLEKKVDGLSGYVSDNYATKDYVDSNIVVLGSSASCNNSFNLGLVKYDGIFKKCLYDTKYYSNSDIRSSSNGVKLTGRALADDIGTHGGFIITEKCRGRWWGNTSSRVNPDDIYVIYYNTSKHSAIKVCIKGTCNYYKTSKDTRSDGMQCYRKLGKFQWVSLNTNWNPVSW